MTAKSKELKGWYLSNVLLGAIFVVLNLACYYDNSVPTVIYWSQLWLTFYNAEALRTIGDLGRMVPNFSFYLFWILMIVNAYFFLKLKKHKSNTETTKS